jgi:hypothetical protein
VCREDSIEKWKSELEASVSVLIVKVNLDFELLTKESIKGATILLSSSLLDSTELSSEILLSIRESTPALQFPLRLNDERIQRLYVNDVAERLTQTILPIQWIHFRCIVYDDIASMNLPKVPCLNADWTWVIHISEEQLCFLPPQLVFAYSKMFRRSEYDDNWEVDFPFKWRLLHGEGCVIPFQFPKVILHKVILKTIRVTISRQENMFLSIIKSMAEQQLNGKIPMYGSIKKVEYSSILLGSDAFGALGCSLDVAVARKQLQGKDWDLQKLESNLDLHFVHASTGTTFAQKIQSCERLRVYEANGQQSAQALDRGNSKFVIDNLRKCAEGDVVCGICYCDPVEIFCLCGHGYCKTCTDIFGRGNTLIVNCPTCRLPLCPIDWISLPSDSVQPKAENKEPNFSAFGSSYHASFGNYKTLSRVQTIVTELNSMFKTRSKLYAECPGCLLVAPESSVINLYTLLSLFENQYSFELSPTKATTQSQFQSQNPNPEDYENEEKVTPLTPRSLNKLSSSLTTPFKKKMSTPRIIVLSFSDFINLKVDTLDIMVMGIIFATPPQPLFSRSYIAATRIANDQSIKSNSKNLNLLVLYTTEFEEDELILAKRVLRREDAELRPRSHSFDKSPRR